MVWSIPQQPIHASHFCSSPARHRIEFAANRALQLHYLLLFLVSWVREEQQQVFLWLLLLLRFLLKPHHLLCQAFLAEVMPAGEYVAREVVVVASPTHEAELVPDLRQCRLAQLRQVQADGWYAFISGWWF
jgi:hypothetical protein